MSHQLALEELLTICQEQELHPTETLSWARKQVREGNWEGINPVAVVMDAQRELGSSYL